MQTQVMEKRVVGVPWLERYREGTDPDQHPLHSFPFSIGRVESADLQIDDSRVSREHAVILREGKTYRIRDLHSTNGTLLNGQRIQDAELTDGDIVVIAGVEFTFYAERSGRSYSMATEVVGGESTDHGTQPRDVIRAVRRLQQALTQRSVDVRFRPLIDLGAHRIFGYEASRAAGDLPEDPVEDLVLSSAPRIAGHLFQLARLVAVEEATRYGLGDHLFLPVEAAEIGSEELLTSLARLPRLAPVGQHLVITMPETVVCDVPYFQTLRTALRELGIRLAYHGFTGTRVHVAEKKAIPPDYLMLAANLTSGIHRMAERQKQLQGIVRACHDLGSIPVVTGLQSEEELRTCHELGVHYGEGNLFGRPGQATVLADRAVEHTLEVNLRR